VAWKQRHLGPEMAPPKFSTPRGKAHETVGKFQKGVSQRKWPGGSYVLKGPDFPKRERPGGFHGGRWELGET